MRDAGDDGGRHARGVQAARLSADQWLRSLVASKRLLVLLAAASVAVGGVWLADWLPGEDWDELRGLVVAVVVSIAGMMLRSDIRRLAEQHVEQLRRATPPATPAVGPIGRARLRKPCAAHT